jgi:hypothetical protein
VLATVVRLANGRRQVDHSFNELGFLEAWHGLVAPHELGSSQTVATFQGRNLAGLFGMDDRFGGAMGQDGHGTGFPGSGLSTWCLF